MNELIALAKDMDILGLNLASEIELETLALTPTETAWVL